MGLSLNTPSQGQGLGPGLGLDQGQGLGLGSGLGQGLAQGQGIGQGTSGVGVPPHSPLTFTPQILDSFADSVRSRTWRMDVQTLHSQCLLLTLTHQVRQYATHTLSTHTVNIYLLTHARNITSQHTLLTYTS